MRHGTPKLLKTEKMAPLLACNTKKLLNPLKIKSARQEPKSSFVFSVGCFSKASSGGKEFQLIHFLLHNAPVALCDTNIINLKLIIQSWALAHEAHTHTHTQSEALRLKMEKTASGDRCFTTVATYVSLQGSCRKPGWKRLRLCSHTTPAEVSSWWTTSDTDALTLVCCCCCCTSTEFLYRHYGSTTNFKYAFGA